jgi:hypothetical protein
MTEPASPYSYILENDLQTLRRDGIVGLKRAFSSEWADAMREDIARDSEALTAATKSDQNPNGVGVVYWIAPDAGQKKSSDPRVFHLCADVSPLRGKTVNSGTVTEAYAENAVRITKQIEKEQGQCGFAKPS